MSTEEVKEGIIIAPKKKTSGEAKAFDEDLQSQQTALSTFDSRPFFSRVWEEAEQTSLLSADFNTKFQEGFAILQNKYIKLRELDFYDPSAMLSARVVVKNLLDVGLFIQSEGDVKRAAHILAGGDFNNIARITLDRVRELRLYARDLNQRSFLQIPLNSQMAKGTNQPRRVALLWGDEFIDSKFKEAVLNAIFKDKKISIYDCINYITTAYDRGETPYESVKGLNVSERDVTAFDDLATLKEALRVVDTLISFSRSMAWQDVFDLSGLLFERPQENHPFGWLRTATMTIMLSSTQNTPGIVVSPETLELFLASKCNEEGEIIERENLVNWFVTAIKSGTILDDYGKYILTKWADICSQALEQITCEIKEAMLIDESLDILQQYYTRFFINYGEEDIYSFHIKPLANDESALLSQLASARSKSERKKILDYVEVEELDIEGVISLLSDAAELAADYIPRLPLQKFTEPQLVELLESANLSDQVLEALSTDIIKRIDISKWELNSVVELYHYLKPDFRLSFYKRYSTNKENLIEAIQGEYEYDKLEALFGIAAPNQLFELVIEFCEAPNAIEDVNLESPSRKALLKAISNLSERDACEFFYSAERKYRTLFPEEVKPISKLVADLIGESKKRAPFSCITLGNVFAKLPVKTCAAVREFFMKKLEPVLEQTKQKGKTAKSSRTFKAKPTKKEKKPLKKPQPKKKKIEAKKINPKNKSPKHTTKAKTKKTKR